MPADRLIPTRATPAAAPQAQWPLVVVLVGVLGGLAYALLVEWRVGAGVIGIAVGIAALDRLLLPDRVAGLLRARSRGFDVALLTLMAIGIVIGAIVVPAAPQ